jgi:hypothetical protein
LRNVLLPPGSSHAVQAWAALAFLAMRPLELFVPSASLCGARSVSGRFRAYLPK